MTKINRPLNPVPRMATYQNWEHLIKLGNLLLYHTIIYKWAVRHYIKNHMQLGDNHVNVSTVHGETVKNNGLAACGHHSCTVHISGHQYLNYISSTVRHKIVTEYSTCKHKQESIRFRSFRYVD